MLPVLWLAAEGPEQRVAGAADRIADELGLGMATPEERIQDAF